MQVCLQASQVAWVWWCAESLMHGRRCWSRSRDHARVCCWQLEHSCTDAMTALRYKDAAVLGTQMFILCVLCDAFCRPARHPHAVQPSPAWTPRLQPTLWRSSSRLRVRRRAALPRCAAAESVVVAAPLHKQDGQVYHYFCTIGEMVRW